MAAKSNKRTTGKHKAKKLPKKLSRAGKTGPKPAPEAVGEVEVVAEAPDLMPPEVLKQISRMNDLVSALDGMTDGELLNSIKACATQASGYSRHAVKAGASALVYAWACGTLLNAAKEKLGHGAFGKWRGEHLVPHAMSERTSTRYMHLAASCHDVRALLEWSPGLRQSYIACGVLPDLSATDRSGDEKEEVPRTAILFTGLSNLQRNMRLFEKTLDGFDKSKEKLSADEKTQLHLMKEEIGKFTDRILKLLP